MTEEQKKDDNKQLSEQEKIEETNKRLEEKSKETEKAQEKEETKKKEKKEKDSEKIKHNKQDGFDVYERDGGMAFSENSSIKHFSMEMSNRLKKDHKKIDNGAIFKDVMEFEDKKGNKEKIVAIVTYISKETIDEINKNKQEITEPLKRDNIKYISENHPNLYTSIQIFLDCIEKYEINNHLNNTIKEVNQHTTSSDSIYLKDKEQIKINNFIYDIKRFQLLILNHPNHLSFTKPDDLFREYHLLFSIITIISESENAEKLLKNIIVFYSNNTESVDL